MTICNKLFRIPNRPIEIQPLNSGVPVGNFPNQSGPLDNLLNFGRSKNPSNLLNKFSILGTTGKLFETLRLLTIHSIHNFFLGKITILLMCIIVLATIGTIIGFKISKDDNPSTTTTLTTSTIIQPTTSTPIKSTTFTTIQPTTPTGLLKCKRINNNYQDQFCIFHPNLDCNTLSEELNELALSTTKNISAWNINAQHGKWTYPDPADPCEDIWSRCDAEYSWYGWEGENNSLGAISVVLYATGKGTLEYGNCGTADGGDVTVYLDGLSIGSTGPETMDEFEFEFHFGQKLELKQSKLNNDSFSIIQFYNIDLVC